MPRVGMLRKGASSLEIHAWRASLEFSLAFSRTRLLLTVAAVRSREEEPIFYYHSCETAALFHMKIIVCCARR
jgi:hypothetical protein